MSIEQKWTLVTQLSKRTSNDIYTYYALERREQFSYGPRLRVLIHTLRGLNPLARGVPVPFCITNLKTNGRPKDWQLSAYYHSYTKGNTASTLARGPNFNDLIYPTFIFNGLLDFHLY